MKLIDLVEYDQPGEHPNDEHEPMDINDLHAIQGQVSDFYEKVKQSNVLSRKENKEIMYWITRYERAYDAGNSETTDEAITTAARLLAQAGERYNLEVPEAIMDTLY